ncbi:hypothetical protein [Bradyrhizobium uaiense]|uniref:Uncharacterized protein n=1 Tax=Bradyrhizobium uaiense TaxID=2594946 RepID=A0A6P1BAK5_9BRAD|nr:hypothetical protein [Bradyrhizobium uaiense]NEU95486.1 hypothetical protein [Bradyrhizobium uaiense]
MDGLETITTGPHRITQFVARRLVDFRRKANFRPFDVTTSLDKIGSSGGQLLPDALVSET